MTFTLPILRTIELISSPPRGSSFAPSAGGSSPGPPPAPETWWPVPPQSHPLRRPAGRLAARLFGSGKIVTGPGISADTRIENVTDTELKLSKPANATVTGATLTVAEPPENVPTNERKLLAIAGSPTQGTFTLTFRTPNPFSTGNTVGDAFAATTSSGSSVLTEVTATSGHGDTQEGSTVVESPTATTGAFEVGQMVSGPGIPAGAVIVKAGVGFFTMSAKATATATGVPLSVHPFLAAGQAVAGPGIPPGTTIESIAGNGDITLSDNATASTTGAGSNSRHSVQRLGHRNAVEPGSAPQRRSRERGSDRRCGRTMDH